MMGRKKPQAAPTTISGQEPRAATAGAPVPTDKGAWRTFVLLALGGGLLTWAALPPWGLSLLGWIAPVPWLLLARGPTLPGRRPYGVLYVCGLAYWLLQLQWIRLPHWVAWFGWLALAAYLAIYLPLLVFLVRALVRQFRFPLVLAAPIAYTALDLVRGHLLGGFSFALLAHSQSDQLAVIQIADLGGAYFVTFIMVLFAGAVASALPGPVPRTLWPLSVAVVAVLMTLGYGSLRLRETPRVDKRVMRVGIVQGNRVTVFNDSKEHREEAVNQYRDQSVAVIQQHPELDVVIWPEAMFTANEPLYSFAPDYASPEGVHPSRREEFRAFLQTQDISRRQALADAVNAAGDHAPGHAAFIVGTGLVHFTPTGKELYNSVAFIGARGEMLQRYDKMHPVMFGEYIPGGEAFPSLYRLTPMRQGLTAGKEPRAFEIAGLTLSPSICYESTVPHLIRSQVATLRAQSKAPDLLLNVTNDGWFHGSSALDLHLRCGVFRAVEMRRPMLLAANSGISAVIDGNGRILERGPRQQNAELVASITADGRESFYLTMGDWPWISCLVLGAAACLSALGSPWRATTRGHSSPPRQ